VCIWFLRYATDRQTDSTLIAILNSHPKGSFIYRMRRVALRRHRTRLIEHIELNVRVVAVPRGALRHVSARLSKPSKFLHK